MQALMLFFLFLCHYNVPATQNVLKNMFYNMISLC